MLKIYNSITKKISKFVPIKNKKVGMYTCGPTVYDYAHIGHARKYVGDDLIKRSLKYLGYQVTHVMNITDVGHLVSDADEGEDKIEKGAKKYNKSVWEIAEFFTNDFLLNINLLNIIKPDILCRATEHIADQISQIENLVSKGFAYETPEAVYFDVSKYKKYFKLFGQNLEDKIVGARDEVSKGEHKKNNVDFVLWFKAVGKYENHIMKWDSPWGIGFPGWHIECSAMSMKYLGEQFDIHTGGIDHLSVHHPNEIAQAECSTGKSPFVKYWIHHNFLLVENEKMSKSKGNVYRLKDLIDKGYTPIDLRYYFLNTSYRKVLNFTFEGLDQAKNSYRNLLNLLSKIVTKIKTKDSRKDNQKVSNEFKKFFKKAIEDDFNIPKALSILWELVKSDLNPKIILNTAIDFDKVFGLQIEDFLFNPREKTKDIKIDREVEDLLREREIARKNKNWSRADEIRSTLKSKFNLEILDTENGPIVVQNSV